MSFTNKEIEMTHYEMAIGIRAQILKSAAEALVYNYLAGFTDCVAYIKALKDFKPVDINALTQQELTDLGFRGWDESGLALIPLWLFPFISETFTGASINDSEVKVFVTKDIDNDNRFGVLAYGVYPNVK